MWPSFRIVVALLAVGGPAYAVEADPAKLKPTTEQIFRAETLAGKLGSDIFLERDTASRELATMGRLALGVVERVLAETDDAEVRSRCEALRPLMLEEDLKARLEAFIADADGKYDHKLPAWDKFKNVVGNSGPTRTLFASMYEHGPTAKMLTASVNAKEEFGPLVVARRMEIYNRIYGRVTRLNGGMVSTTERTPPTPTEVAGQLFAEGLLGSVNDRRYSYAINTMLQQASVRDNLNDAVKGEPLRKLFAHWCDTRTDANEMYTAMTTAANLNLKDVPVTKYAIKVLDAKTMTAFYRAYAITTVAKHGGKDQMPVLLKQFEDKTVLNAAFVNANGQVERMEMQLRDVALAMAITVTDQKPEDYGFVMRANTEVSKYTYNNYRLASDEKRTEAFKKWNEWLSKNPQKK